MYTEKVEIYSDSPNEVVLRVPWRRYPGTLIQGDDLFGLSGRADRACSALLARFRSLEPSDSEHAGIRALLSLENDLRALRKHYERVMRKLAISPSSTFK